MAQVNVFAEQNKEIEDLILVIMYYVNIWKKIFSLAKSVDMKKPLTTKIL